MIYYFVAASENDVEWLVGQGVKNILISYHYIRKKNPKSGRMKGKLMTPQKLREMYPQVENIFLDCGAFSSLASGEEIDLDAYTRFCIEQEDYYTICATLDPLWDKSGVTVGTFRNYCYMLNKGVKKMMPVFHGNPSYFYVLEEYARMTDYIAIGSGTSRKSRIKIFKMFPEHRFHGFAQTDWWGLNRFPFYSADSSTWAKTPAFGFHIHKKIRYAGLRHQYGISDLQDSRVYDNVRNYMNRREALTQETLKRWIPTVECRFGNYKYIEPFQRKPNPDFKVDGQTLEGIGDHVSVKIMRAINKREARKFTQRYRPTKRI